MRIYFYGFILLFRVFILRKNKGKEILKFAEKMGVVYIKFAQLLAMQNYGNLFTEDDRVALSKICDSCNPIKFKKIKKIIENEYGLSIEKKFKKIYEKPIGSASISQVHKAILKNGDVVVLKIKREDVTKKVNKDIEQIRRLVHRSGKFFHFKNFIGGDHALDLYLSWINEEIDFVNERKNIKEYQKYANVVNGKIKDSVKIVAPHVYNKLSTDKIIVMEYIPYLTINNLKLNKKNKERISRALNDYIRLSFYAMLHGFITFHGDPHGGNIYIDKEGNIGFLDFGLIFSLTEEEIKLTIELLLSAYNNNIEKLCEILLDESVYERIDEARFYEDVKKQCAIFKHISIPQFYLNMIHVFTKYDIQPPSVFFKMAKAYVAVFGINNFIDNKTISEELLYPLIVDYYVNRTVTDFKDIFVSTRDLLPKFVKDTLNNGILDGVVNQITELNSLNKKINETFNNCNEIANIIKNLK